MTITTALKAIEQAYDLLPRAMATPEASVMLLTIGLQESKLTHRRQIVNGTPTGPAKGLWQFERGGGVIGVMTHIESQDLARWVLRRRGVGWNSGDAWDELQYDDVLAAAFARLLLWTDTKPLPAVSHANVAWNYYLRVWRPGKPHPKTWAAHHALAVKTVVGQEGA